MNSLVKISVLFITCLSLQACSGVLPVPGGRSTINDDFYHSDAEMQASLESLKIGMTEQVVFSKLGREKEDLNKLDRQGIIQALYGGQFSPYISGSAENPYANLDLKALSGYELNCRSVKRKHGLKSPISIRTNEQGYDYKATMIFLDGALFEAPIISGGLIDSSSSKTLFDYLNPSMVFKRL